MGELLLCEWCHGTGKVMAFVDGVDAQGRRWGRQQPVSCFHCGGVGQITPEHAARIKAGHAHRDARLARLETSRDCAQRLGVSVQDLAKMEMGRIPFPTEEEACDG